MPTISSSKVPSPKSWDEFEEITLSAAKLRWNSTDFIVMDGRDRNRTVLISGDMMVNVTSEFNARIRQASWVWLLLKLR